MRTASRLAGTLAPRIRSQTAELWFCAKQLSFRWNHKMHGSWLKERRGSPRSNSEMRIAAALYQRAGARARVAELLAAWPASTTSWGDSKSCWCCASELSLDTSIDASSRAAPRYLARDGRDRSPRGGRSGALRDNFASRPDTRPRWQLSKARCASAVRYSTSTSCLPPGSSAGRPRRSPRAAQLWSSARAALGRRTPPRGQGAVRLSARMRPRRNQRRARALARIRSGPPGVRTGDPWLARGSSA